MYRAKRDGKGSYRLFEPEMHQGVLARLELRTDLQRAIATEQLELYYQPVVRIHDASISGVEALLRWRHPERGMIPPDQFIPLAEETGLIIPIGRWVLREGCRHARRMRSAVPAGEDLTMGINLSVKQLQHSDVIADVRDAVEEAGIEPSALTLEITETVLMADTELAVTRLQELKALGVNLALDDFGTGYSSLSYLSRFPVDILKMDRSFLREGATPEMSRARLRRAGTRIDTEPGRRRGGHRAARAVGLAAQLGCEFGQGFFFAARWTPRRRSSTWRSLASAGGRAARRCTIATRPWTGRAASRASACSCRCATPSSASSGSAMCVSLLGDGAFLVAVAWQVYELSNTPTAMSRGRHRDDRADDRVPAARRRGERPLRPAAGDGRRGPPARGRRPGARRRSR